MLDALADLEPQHRIGHRRRHMPEGRCGHRPVLLLTASTRACRARRMSRARSMSKRTSMHNTRVYTHVNTSSPPVRGPAVPYRRAQNASMTCLGVLKHNIASASPTVCRRASRHGPVHFWDRLDESLPLARVTRPKRVCTHH